MSRLDVVVGAAYGSEGKGHVTAQIVQRRLDEGMDVLNIRVAGPNAGHTVIDKAGNRFPLRTVPVGMAIADKVYGYIAPGSEIEVQVLLDELRLLREHGHRVEHLFVSGEATLLEEHHKAMEAEMALVARLGSTGKGIGAARADRIYRLAKRVMDDPTVVLQLEAEGITIVPSEENLPSAWLTQQRASVIIEGTQGFGLGLHAGYYPQSTSSDCRAVDFMAMSGISPWQAGIQRLNIWLVARMFPIRVAGNSGPMKGETTWAELGLPEEHTTVTHKVRRVGEWDSELVKRAVIDNGGGTALSTRGASVLVALTMVDQKWPGMAGVTNLPGYAMTGPDEEVEAMREFFRQVELETGAAIGAVTTSPNTIAWLV